MKKSPIEKSIGIFVYTMLKYTKRMLLVRAWHK